MIHCILFDDDADFVSKFKNFTAQEKGVRLDLITSDAEDVRSYLKSGSKIDVIIFDIEMEDSDSLVFCDELKNNYPHIKLLLSTSLQNANSINKILACGAHGFFPKNQL